MKDDKELCERIVVLRNLAARTRHLLRRLPINPLCPTLLNLYAVLICNVHNEEYKCSMPSPIHRLMLKINSPSRRQSRPLRLRCRRRQMRSATLRSVLRVPAGFSAPFPGGLTPIRSKLCAREFTALFGRL